MNKKELIEHIADNHNLTKTMVEIVVNATFDTLRDEMVKQETTAIAGFGQFGAKVRAARKGRNPSTGEEIDIPEAVVPTFKAASALKNTVNTQS